MIRKISFFAVILFISLSTASITRDKIITEESEPIAPFNDEIFGTTRVRLDGNCGNAECNLGNFIADSFVDWHAEHLGENNEAWTAAAIAMIESGAIGASFERGIDGLKQQDVESCLSGEKIVIVEVTGAVLKSALEHSVSNYKKDKGNGKFLQFSGMNVVYNVSEPSGERVLKVELLCADCVVPALEPLDSGKNYKILMQESLAKGSNGYTMFADKITDTFDIKDTEIFIEYLKKKSPIYPAVEWRITVHGKGSTVVASVILLISSALLTLLSRF